MDHLLQSAEFWVAVAFVIFVIFMLWKATKPMMAALDARAERIKTEIDEAKRLREEAQKLLAEYQRKERDAAKEAEAMLHHAREEATRLREKAAEDLKASVKRREQQALDRIAQAEAQAEAQVRAAAADAAVAMAENMLREKMDAAAQSALVSQGVNELAKKFG